MKKTILLIEDEKIMRITLEDALRGAGYEVNSFETGAAALKDLKQNYFDVAVTDVRLPDMDGFDIVGEITRQGNEPVIIMTAFGTIKDAVKAMKLGAFDYITKPFALDEFFLLIERALGIKRLKEENLRLKKDLGKCYGYPNIIGESEEMKKVFFLIDKVSASDSTVLILGESGTGKELVAGAIHSQSNRRDRPLIKVNCAALPEGLLESELFGHEKGAFTGAIRKKPGRFELADSGTIFLDEIGDLPLQAQSKLLRVLQEKTIERVGGTESIKVDVRLITATNKKLQEEVKAGRFREDLYYRLNVIPILIPALRERKEDIPALIEFLLDKIRTKLLKNVRCSKDAVERLIAYDFPGNVRELENILERSAALSPSDVVERDDLPSFIINDPATIKRLDLSAIAAEAEKGHIIRILKTTQGNKTRASEILGISRKTLWEKMNAYGIK